MPLRPLPRPSLRVLVTAGTCAVLGAVLTACGGAASTPTAASGASTRSWSFVDDRKVTVSAPSTPERVVAFTGAAAALADFGVSRRVVGVFGETKRKDGTPEPQAGDLDLDRVQILGNAWGEFNIERYATLRPQLLVTHMYDPKSLWYVPDESKDKITSLAPTAAINVNGVPLTTPIERYAELAASLGADLNDPKVTAAKTRFERAAERLRAVAGKRGGITVLAGAGSPDLFYVSNPKMASDLMYFAQLGVRFVQPTKLDQGGYFEGLSWESAGRYDADVILLDKRPVSLQPNALAAKPTWKQLPAVRAGQVVAWDAVPRFSYAGAAPLLEDLAKAISAAREVA